MKIPYDSIDTQIYNAVRSPIVEQTDFAVGNVVAYDNARPHAIIALVYSNVTLALDMAVRGRQYA